MSKSIKWTVHTVNSKTDVNGNRYWFATYTRMSDGKSATFLANHKSNAESICYHMAGGWDRVKYTTQEMGIRDFNRQAKDLPYLNDCNPTEAAKSIKKELA